jgi:hypothetical protein
MYFRDEEIHADGPNVTIRKGEKWNKLNPGEKFELVETGTANTIGYGVAKETMTMPFMEVPDYIFDRKVLPATQTRSQMLKELKSNYENFEKHDIVTVVLFDLI